MTEYVKHEFDGRVREVAARWTNSSGVKYIWLVSTDGLDPSSFFDDHWEELPSPKTPRQGETWQTSRGEQVTVIGHNDLPIGWIFAYQFNRPNIAPSGSGSYTHVRNVDEQVQNKWKRIA